VRFSELEVELEVVILPVIRRQARATKLTIVIPVAVEDGQEFQPLQRLAILRF